MTETKPHEIESLRRALPPAVPASDVEREKVLRALRGRIDAEIRPSAHRLRPRWLVPASALGASAAIAAVLALSVGTGGEGPTAAGAALREAADVARAQPAPPQAGPGEYFYSRSVDAYLATSIYSEDLTFSVLEPHVRETWIGPEGGRLRQTPGEPRFLSDRDRESWIEAGRPEVSGPAGEPQTVALPPAQPLDLPTDPDALYEEFERIAIERDEGGSGSGIAEYIFTQVGDALRETNISPELRAALYEVASRIPNVELVGDATDPIGRTGVAVSIDDSQNRIGHTLIIDPDTALLLAEEQVALEGNWSGYPEGTVIGHATYVTGAIVDELGERPRR